MTLIGILVLLSYSSVLACNCVACDRSTLIPGGSSWCRCCVQTFNPECVADQTTDQRCQQSVFDAAGCLAAGFGDTLCTATDESSDGAGFRQIDPTQASNQTDTLVGPETFAPEVVPEPSPTWQQRVAESRPCNCPGCSLNHVQGTPRWCNCCNVLFDQSCEWNELCNRTIFTISGCNAASWSTVCARSEAILLDDVLNGSGIIDSGSLTNLSSASAGSRIGSSTGSQIGASKGHPDRIATSVMIGGLLTLALGIVAMIVKLSYDSMHIPHRRHHTVHTAHV